MRKYGKTVALVVVCGLVAWGVSRAMASKYQQKRTEILAGCKAERDKLGPAEQKALEGKCATPEISLVSPSNITPGQTVDVTVTGKFPAGTRFLFESDCVEVLKESVAPNSYCATIQLAASCGPHTIGVTAFAPVCCKSGRKDGALKVGGSFAWDMTASNGWRIKATAAAPLPGMRESSEQTYVLEFFRGSETAPFRKHQATLYGSNTLPATYNFSISEQNELEGSPMVEMQKIGAQLMDPNLSDAEREKVMKRYEQLLQTISKEANKLSDPNYIKQMEAKKAEFDCRHLDVTSQNGTLTGTMNCSQKVGSLKITGTMKLLGR